MLNQCSFIGNVGKDPEVKNFANGGKVASFSLAVTERWKDKDGGKQERTEWVNVSILNEGLIGVAERYVKKGSKVFIQGKLQTRKWQKDGEDRYMTEVVLAGYGGTIVLLDARPAGGQVGRPVQQTTGDLDDDVPF